MGEQMSILKRGSGKSKFSWIQLRANETFKSRIAKAVEARGGGTVSGYVRDAILEKLERDGVE